MKSPGENINPAEQAALCQRLVPAIIEATEAFFQPLQPHPFLSGLAQGGHVYSHPERDTKDTEHIVTVEVHGFRDTYDPEKFEKIGIPREVAAEGLMWVLFTRESELEKDLGARPAEKSHDVLSHAFTYWDGTQWCTRRKREGADIASDVWESMWEASENTDEETTAMQAVVTQTQHIHQIADAFNGDKYAFEDMILQFPRDTRRLIVLSRGLTYAFNTPWHGGTLLPEGLPRYMQFHQTGYQSGDLIRTASRLATHESFKLDSGGLSTAMYHRSSVPPTPGMIAGGENIPLRNMHPPVPIDFIEA